MRRGVGLGQRRDARLLSDTRASQVGRFGRQIGVANTALRSGDVGNLRGRQTDGELQPVLTAAHIGLKGAKRGDRCREQGDGVLGVLPA